MSPLMTLTPHDWQREAAARAEHENLIVSAETGAGKTLVAELAILDAIRRHPDKRIAFMVTASRLLAHQQWMRVNATLAKHEGAETWECVEFTGFTTSGWGPKEYASVLRAKVLVGTVETFTKAFIDHGFFHFDEFSLFIVDECHEARGESPAVELLWRLHRQESGDSLAPNADVRVLGLTASFASCKASSREDFSGLRRELQAVMQSKMHHVPRTALPARKMPTFQRVEYPRNEGAEVAEVPARALTSEIWEELQQHGVTCDCVEKIVRELALLLLELGSEAFLFGLEHGVVSQVLAQIEKRQIIPAAQSEAQELQEQLAALKSSLSSVLARARGSQHLQSFKPVADKANALIDCVRKEFASRDQNVVGMCFVNEVCLSLPLANLLQTSLGITAAAVCGTKAMSEKERNTTFHDFAKGTCKFLVGTRCAEEGLDVAECSFVVRFSRFHTTRSHIQGVGRARAIEAKVYYFENDPLEELAKEDLMYDVANDPDEILSTLADIPNHRRVLPGLHPYVIPETHAEVNLKNASSILSEYVAATTSGKVEIKQLQDASHLRLPGPQGGLKLPMAEVLGFFPPVLRPNDRAACHYVGVLVLHCKGWLDEHNCVPKRVIRESQRVAWPEPEEAPEVISLGHMMFPKGLLGNQTSNIALAQFRQRAKETRPQHTASGAEQVIIGQHWLDITTIHNTQDTVNHHFTDGRSVWRGLRDLVLGKVQFDDITRMRVARSPDDGLWYSADNRRLFSIKVVGPLIGKTTVYVDEINWTKEMTNKCDQHARFGEVWRTDAATICQVRKQLQEELRKGPAPSQSSPLNPSLVSAEEELLGRAQGIAEAGELDSATASSSRESPPIVLKKLSSFPPLHPKDSKDSTQPARPRGGAQRPKPAEPDSGQFVLPEPSSRAAAHVEGRALPSAPKPAPAEPTLRGGQSTLSPRASVLKQEVIPPESELEQELLRRIGASVAKNPNVDSCRDPVSMLYMAVHQHMRPSDKALLPLHFDDWLCPDGCFCAAATLCGMRVQGTPGPNKKAAKQSAAMAALKAACDASRGRLAMSLDEMD